MVLPYPKLKNTLKIRKRHKGVDIIKKTIKIKLIPNKEQQTILGYGECHLSLK